MLFTAPPYLEMSNFESEGPSENEWDDRGELAWNEFDWENYLRGQDEVVLKYLGFYDKSKSKPDRIDQVAHQMGWDLESWSSDDDDDDVAEGDAPAKSDDGEGDYDDSDPYTLHKNPIFIATKAIYLSLKRSWEKQAVDPAKVPQPLALAIHSSLGRGEEQATLAIQALDFGDYAMAISLFKRALRELNHTFSLLADRKLDSCRSVAAMREDVTPKLFDLREIWLRVMGECRDELERPTEDDEDDE